MAHQWVAARVISGDSVIDGTVGNGHDTAFLAGLVGDSGLVFAFDVQSKALEVAKKRLSDSGCLEQTRLILDGHENLSAHVGTTAIKAVMFNLGYLPGSDKTQITKAETTIPALKGALESLSAGGIVTLVVYVGHLGGLEESESILRFCENLDSAKFRAMRYDPLNSRKAAPFLVGIERVAS